MKKFAIEFKWALIFTAASLAWMYMENAVGLHGLYIEKHPVYTNLFAIVAISLFVLAMRDKKKNYFDGQMSFSQGFLSGMVMSVFIAVMTPAVQYITARFISPDFFDNMVEYTVRNKIYSPVQAKAYFNAENYMRIATFGALSAGIVTSALVAVFIKSKKIS
jgi:hypothetical protein